MSKRKVFVVTLIGIISVLFFTEVGKNFLFLILIVLSPAIHFLLFPFSVYILFVGITYPALLVAILASSTTAFIVPKYTDYKLKITILSSLVVFICILYPYSKYLGESRIRAIAKEQYSQNAIDVKINLAAWYKVGDFIHGDRHLGSPHGYVYIDDCKANWSFGENDFIKGRFCK